MNWTQEMLDRVPEVYRDFMLTLKPIVDSRQPNVVLRINGIHIGQVYGALSAEHDYKFDQVRELARNLRREGWIEEDSLGFFTPTAKGEQFILALTETAETNGHRVPPLPSF
jgi:hypothetical protein